MIAVGSAASKLRNVSQLLLAAAAESQVTPIVPHPKPHSEPADLPDLGSSLARTLSTAARAHTLRHPDVRGAVRLFVRRARARAMPVAIVVLELKRCIQSRVAPHVTEEESLELARQAMRWALHEYFHES
jgi:hypothetical protein